MIRLEEISDLEKFFKDNNHREIRKWHHYFEIYERYFKEYRGKNVVILEIGVSQGGSLQMWSEYFGKKAKIYGIDIDPRCKDFEEENIKIFIGSQLDRKFLRRIKKEIPKVDILIDDGGHMMKQQIISFEELFDHVKENGVYLCEDTHTSYWLRYGGGYKRPHSFIEYSKNFIDKLHAFHSEQNRFKVSHFTASVNSVHFYDSVVVVEKGRREAPFQEKSGQASFEEPKPLSQRQKFRKRGIKITLVIANKVLRFFRLPGLFWR
jgi:23S rRNA U2552 (ribose-2'-O)-methylase RlmE/FtsJ